MTYIKECIKTGHFLFRWRSYLPFLYLVILIPGLMEFEYWGGSKASQNLWTMFCLAVSCLGFLIRCYTIGFVPRGTSGRNTKNQQADELNTTGIYSQVRNPLYLGNFFIGLGFTMFVHIWWVSLIYVLVFWLYYERIIFTEEDFLMNKFKDAYLEWSEHVPVFIPKFKTWVPNSLEFSFRNVLKRETYGLLVIISAYTLLNVLTETKLAGHFDYDSGWLIAFISGMVGFLLVRLIIKKTEILVVEGR